MAALMLANNKDGADAMTHEGMNMDMSGEMAQHTEPISNTVEFPYGFPSPGRYRIFVQMKHGPTVETGTFDATVQ